MLGILLGVRIGLSVLRLLTILSGGRSILAGRRLLAILSWGIPVLALLVIRRGVSAIPRLRVAGGVSSLLVCIALESAGATSHVTTGGRALDYVSTRKSRNN